jgi:hypothetical protein
MRLAETCLRGQKYPPTETGIYVRDLILCRDIQYMEPDVSVGAATRGWAAQGSGFYSWQGQEVFRLRITSRPVHESTQPAQWEPRLFLRG